MQKITMFGVGVAALLGAVTYSAKQEVMLLEGQLSSLQRSLLVQQESQHLLKAEWAHLSSPERLQGLAQKHLNMGTMGGWQLVCDAEMRGLLEREAPAVGEMRYASARESAGR
jgi:cell division protein FtsL